ncbi:MAG: GNAT family N-acetyltransferase [Clostridiales bacterium]|nr:GNAT family N-acetyltransferase [Clostridiales bacterium]
MTKIYLVRHGEAEGNAYRRSHGWYDSLLTKKARERQLPALLDRFSNIKIDAVYSSDILRAHQTVQGIADAHNVELIPEPGLRELNMGEWEDCTWGELPIKYPTEMDAWQRRPWEVKIPGGETYKEAEKRVRDTILRIAEKHKGETVVAGTHGAVARAILSTSLYGSLDSMNKITWCDNTAVSLLLVEDGNIRIDFLNDNSHLNLNCSTLESQKWWRDGDEPTDFNLWFRPVDFEKDMEKFLYYGREFYLSAYGQNAAFVEEEFILESKRMQKQNAGSVMFAMMRDKVYGLLRLDTEALEGSESGLIKTVIVAKEARGKGYASQLLGEAISVYRRIGKKAIVVNVAEKNEQARNFYTKHGFISCGEIPGHIVMKKEIQVINPLRTKN